ncbi:class I SAM-dependent methyltransferase [Candidatus Pelagibacter bacterium nBUS_49]|uniref:class I SAM-dependent methyltransferase n=1 Tax=Candidatus Pelagibacter bacterium nBUS_49 TaxID=3374196 RepID=UPI003EBD9D36
MKIFNKKPFKVNGNIKLFSLISNKSIESHAKVKGTKIDSLEKTPFSLPFWETKYYKKIIKKYIKNYNKNISILDAGCGDGRFTLLLLEMGFKNIVSVDSSIHSLKILDNKLKKINKSKYVTLVHGSILDVPFARNYFDIILCIGVLYYLNNNYEKGLKKIVKCLKKNGLLLETEPDKEGNALKAMIFDGIHQYLNVVKKNKFIEYFGDKPIQLRCFDEKELKNIFKTYNLNVLNKEIISLFPSILTIGRKNSLIVGIENDIKQIKKIRDSFDYFFNEKGVAKHKLWVLKKIENKI